MEDLFFEEESFEADPESDDLHEMFDELFDDSELEFRRRSPRRRAFRRRFPRRRVLRRRFPKRRIRRPRLGRRVRGLRIRGGLRRRFPRRRVRLPIHRRRFPRQRLLRRRFPRRRLLRRRVPSRLARAVRLNRHYSRVLWRRYFDRIQRLLGFINDIPD